MAASPPLPGPPEPARGPLPHEKCPHCGSLALIEPSGALRFQCGVCGRARVPVDDPDVPRSGAELESLRAATAARDGARAWAVGAALASGFALLSLLVLLLVVLAAGPPTTSAAVGFFAAAVPLLLAAFGARRARQKRAEVAPALDQAYRAVARDLAEALGKVQPSDLATRMRLKPEEAETLLIHLSAEGAVHSSIAEEGSLEFEADRPRLRVEHPPEAALPQAEQSQQAEGPAATDEISDAEAEALEQAGPKALEAKR